MTAAELGTVLRKLGQLPSEAEIQVAIRQMDADGSGKVEFADFLRLAARKIKQQRSHLSPVFKPMLPTLGTGSFSQLSNSEDDKITQNIRSVLSSLTSVMRDDRDKLSADSLGLLGTASTHLMALQKVIDRRNQKHDLLTQIKGRRSSVMSDSDDQTFKWIVSEFVPEALQQSAPSTPTALSRTNSTGSVGSSPGNSQITTMIKERKTSSRASILSVVSDGERQVLMAMPDSDRAPTPAQQSSLTLITEIALFPNVAELLTQYGDSWDIDIFYLDELTNHRPLSVLGKFYFDKYNMAEIFGIPEENFANFIWSIEAAYLENPYHNRLHAADVMASVHFFLTRPSLADSIQDADILITLLAGAVHDVGHPGTNNAFQVNTSSEWATLYNDVSVLENMHISTAFAMMKKEKHDLFSHLPVKERNAIRKAMIDAVLGTDMTKHFQHQTVLSDVLQLKKDSNVGFSKDVAEDRALLRNIIVHAGDLANPTKPNALCTKWTARVVEEFFNQGDTELALGLDVGMLNNRHTVNVPGSQCGFIDVLVAPFFALVANLIPEASVCVDNMKANRAYWATLCPPKNPAAFAAAPAKPTVASACFSCCRGCVVVDYDDLLVVK